MIPAWSGVGVVGLCEVTPLRVYFKCRVNEVCKSIERMREKGSQMVPRFGA